MPRCLHSPQSRGTSGGSAVPSRDHEEGRPDDRDRSARELQEEREVHPRPRQPARRRTAASRRSAARSIASTCRGRARRRLTRRSDDALSRRSPPRRRRPASPGRNVSRAHQDATRDADRALREHAAAHLSELVAALEVDGEAAAGAGRSSRSSSLSPPTRNGRRSQVRSASSSHGCTDRNPGDVSFSRADEAYRAAATTPRPGRRGAGDPREGPGAVGHPPRRGRSRHRRQRARPRRRGRRMNGIDRLRADLARERGLPDTALPFLEGGTVLEVEAQADRLAALLGTTRAAPQPEAAPAPDPFAVASEQKQQRKRAGPATVLRPGAATRRSGAGSRRPGDSTGSSSAVPHRGDARPGTRSRLVRLRRCSQPASRRRPLVLRRRPRSQVSTVVPTATERQAAEVATAVAVTSERLTFGADRHRRATKLG